MAAKMQSAPPAAAAPETKADGKKKLPLIIVAVVLLCLGGGFIAVKSALAKKAGKTAADGPVKVGEVVPLDEFMLNLADPTDDHYLKTTISLGLAEGVSADKFKDKVPETRDAIIMVLSSKRLASLRSDAGKTELKKEIEDKVNAAVGEPDVAAVYFQDFATQ